MSFAGCFGLGAKRIIAENNITDGIVTEVKVCWWLKVNTKPVRAHALDGAVYPHIIYFTYIVGGVEYKGSRYVSWNAKCPQSKANITVYYDREKPEKYAVVV